MSDIELSVDRVARAVMAAFAKLEIACNAAALEDQRLREDLSVDSFQALEVIVAIEQELTRRFPPGSELEFADVVTVGELIRAVHGVLRRDGAK